MSNANHSSRLIQLAHALQWKREKLIRLIRRLSSPSIGDSGKPSMLRKMLAVLDQVAVEQEKENDILSQIQMVERQHAYKRRCLKLQRAAPQPARKARKRDEELEQKFPRPDRDIWVWVAACMAFAAKSRSAKQTLSLR